MSKSAETGVGAESLAGRLLQRLPGGRFAQEQIERVERRVLGELKQRLDRLEAGQAPSMSVVAVSVRPRVSNGTADLIGESPARLLRELLQMSAEQDRGSAEQAYFALVLGSLLPDEARILSALSDGSAYPTLDVFVGSRLGPATRPVLEWVSSVGKSAGVQCGELTPVYLRRLHAWGLIELHVEDPAQRVKYEILETDASLRETVERFTRAGQRTRLARGMVKVTALGAALWEAGRVEEIRTF